MEVTEVPVLVVGGSLVGMFMAALLGQHGVEALVAERHRSTAIHPRAAFIYQRSMEVVRGFGIEEVVRQRSFQQFEPDGAILSVESIAGKELHRDVPHMNEGVRDLSPCERLFITQQALEPMLERCAKEYGAELRFATEVVSLEQVPEGVLATLRDRESGQERRVRARYVVAADGAHSRVREQLGIGNASDELAPGDDDGADEHRERDAPTGARATQLPRARGQRRRSGEAEHDPVPDRHRFHHPPLPVAPPTRAAHGDRRNELRDVAFMCVQVGAGVFSKTRIGGVGDSDLEPRTRRGLPRG